MNELFNANRYPPSPGCFLIKDAQGRALMVGATVNLSRRLAALYEESQQPPPKTRVNNRLDDRVPRLVMLAREIEVFLLPSSEDCLALANCLIERWRPLFNLATYLEASGASYITHTDEAYPRLVPSGHQAADAPLPGDCYGPFPSSARDLLLKTVTESFGLRTCHPMPRRACLSYHLKLCCAPCEGYVSQGDYAVRVTQADQVLSTPGPQLIQTLQAGMQSAAEAMEFERAGRIRGQIQALEPVLLELEEAPSRRRASDHDQDVIYLACCKALIVQIRGGALYDMAFLDAPGESEEAAYNFLRQRYSHHPTPEIILNIALPNLDGLASELSSSRGSPVTLTLPTSGPASDLLEIARQNHAYRMSLIQDAR